MDPTNEKVRVRFITKHDEFRVPDAPIAIPVTLNRSGLIEVINHLLSREEIQAFDFLIDNRILRQSLYKLFQKLQLSTENVITVEYFPSVSLSEQSEGFETPAWIGSLDSQFAGSVFVGTYDGQLQVVNTQSYATDMSVQAHEEPIRAMTCVPYSTHLSTASVNEDIALVATAGKDKSVKVWGYQPSSHRISSAPFITFDGHINSVECLAYYSDDHLLLSGDWSGNIFAWDLKAAAVQTHLHSQFTKAGNSVFNTSGGTSGSSDQPRKKKKKAAQTVADEIVTDDAMDISDVSSSTELKPLFTIHAHAQKVSSINVIPDSRQIMTASWDHLIKIYDMETQNSIHHFSTLKVITSIDYKPSFHLILSSHTDGKIRLWDSRQKESVSSLETYGKDKELTAGSWVAQVKWQPLDSNYLFASADYDGCVKLWDMRSSTPLGSNSCHDGKALCVEWCATDDGWSIVSGGSDCFLKSTPLQT